MTEIKLKNNGYWVDSDIGSTKEWQWCMQRFGKAGNNKNSNYWQGNINWFDVIFRFNNPMHATMFALRWAEQ